MLVKGATGDDVPGLNYISSQGINKKKPVLHLWGTTGYN